MNVSVVDGDLLNQDVEAIVNAWNRNVITWWLLLPQGVSGAIKKRGGTQPFREIAKMGAIPLGEARLTAAGNLPFKAILHVAGIDMLWRASEYSIRESARSAMKIAEENGFASVAFPIIGAGSGGFDEERALAILRDELQKIETASRVIIVRFRLVKQRRKSQNSCRKRFFLGAIFVLAPLFIWVFHPMQATDFSSNRAQTAPEHADANLKTRFYTASVEEVAKTLRALVPDLKTYGRAWRLNDTARQNDGVTLRIEVPVLVFTDDLTVSLSSERGRTRVDVTSKSRVGKGDFGENRRHIAQLLQRLDAEMSSKKTRAR